jgi:hypothetical protein
MCGLEREALSSGSWWVRAWGVDPSVRGRRRDWVSWRKRTSFPPPVVVLRRESIDVLPRIVSEWAEWWLHSYSACLVEYRRRSGGMR